MPTSMTIDTALRLLTQQLRKSESDAPFVVARALFCHVLAVDSMYIVQHANAPLAEKDWEKIQGLAARHMRHEPLAYIVENKEFYGRNFFVSPATLIPRPETEDMLEMALHFVKQKNNTSQGVYFADIGTGSGCLAISLAAEISAAKGIMLDISRKALEVAAHNAKRHRVHARLLPVRGDLTGLPFMKECFDICISNPPYVSEREYATLAPHVKNYEPKIALVPTEDKDFFGLKYIEYLAKQCHFLLKARGVMLVEHGHEQGKRVREIFLQAAPWARVETYNDLAGLERFCFCQKK